MVTIHKASFDMIYTNTNRVEMIFTDGLLIMEEEPPTSVEEPRSEVGVRDGSLVVEEERSTSVEEPGSEVGEVVGTGVEPTAVIETMELTSAIHESTMTCVECMYMYSQHRAMGQTSCTARKTT